MKIQYLWLMLNNINCVPDEKDSQKHVYIVYFSLYVSFEDEEKNQQNTPNAAIHGLLSLNIYKI